MPLGNKKTPSVRAAPVVDSAVKERLYDDGLRRFDGAVFGGLVDDYRRRARHVYDDYAIAFTHWDKALSAAVSMWLATMFSTLSLAHFIYRHTECDMGVAEYLAANSFFGMVHALFGAQPLLVLRPTGPITAIIDDIFLIAKGVGVDFLPLFAATGVCVGACMTIVVAFELSRFIRQLTPWSIDVFTCYVCSIYIYQGLSSEVKRYTQSNPASPITNLTSTFLCMFVLFIIPSLHFKARSWSRSLGWPRLPGKLLAEYAVLVAVLLTTGLAAIRVAAIGHQLQDTMRIERIELHPNTFHRLWQPTDLSATDNRTWGTALLLALPITLFFYIDQNISCLMCQRGLSRGQYYHAPFFAMSAFNVCGPLLGMPFVTASLPHSPQLAASLLLDSAPHGAAEPKAAEPSSSAASASTLASKSGPRFAENRLTPLLMYALVGLPLALPSIVSVIPTATMHGVLIWVGVEGLMSTQLFLRFVRLVRSCSTAFGWLHLSAMDQLFAEAGVDESTERMFTGYQLLCYFLCLSFFIASEVTGYSVDLAVGLLVIAFVQPLREVFIKPQLTAHQLWALDTVRLDLYVPGSDTGEEALLVDSSTLCGEEALYRATESTRLVGEREQAGPAP